MINIKLKIKSIVIVSIICILIPLVISGCKSDDVSIKKAKTQNVTTSYEEEVIINPVIKYNLSLGDMTPEKGEAAITKNSQGLYEIIYTPKENVYGNDKFIYKANNGVTYYTVTVNVTIEEPEPIAATNDVIEAKEDTAIKIATVLDNDTSVIDGSLELVGFTSVKSGDIEKIDGEYSFVPEENFNGQASFNYTLKDALSREGTASVIVNIAPVNDAPVANDDRVQAFNDEAILIDVLENDIDVEADELVIIEVKNGNENGEENSGKIEIRDNKLYYTPDYKKTAIDKFTYIIKDSSEDELQASGLLTIGINSRDDVIEKQLDVLEEESVELSVPGQVIEMIEEVEHGILEVINMEDAYNNRFHYTPDENFNGQDSFSLYYKSLQNDKIYYMKININIEQVNDEPKAEDDEFTVEEDSSSSIFDVLENDKDVDGDKITIENVNESDKSSIKIQDNKIIYTPNENFAGEENIQYTINDGNGETSTANIKIEVMPINDAPIAYDDVYQIDETNNRQYLDVLKNDIDVDGDELTIESVESETQAVSQYDNKISYNASEPITEDKIIYTIKDKNGVRSKATVTVTVNPTNDDPVARFDYIKIDEDSGVQYFNVLSNDYDEEGDKLTLSELSCDYDYEILEIANNKIKFKSEENDFGYIRIDYSVSDGNGGVGHSYLDLDIKSVNDPPTAVDDEYTVYGDSDNNRLEVKNNDYDVDNYRYFANMDICDVSNPQHGEAKKIGNAIYYTPDKGFIGRDSFEYTINDNYYDNKGKATVYINVDGPNTAPVAEDDSYEVQEDSPSNTFDVLSNDSDYNEDKLTIEWVGILGSSTEGKSTHGGSARIIEETRYKTETTETAYTVIPFKYYKIVYTPNKNFNGEDTVYYRINDGNEGSTVGKIEIIVESVNDAPIARRDEFIVEENSLDNIFDVVSNDFDVDEDILTIESVEDSSYGLAKIENNKIVYTPNSDFYGSDTFSYTVKDGNDGKSTASITVTIKRNNVEPVTQDDEFTVNIDSQNNYFNVLANDSDADGDILTIQNIGQSKNSTARIVLNTIEYTPSPSFSGQDTITYKVKDGFGGESTATVNINVSENHAPKGIADTFNIEEDCEEQVLDVLANDYDEDNDDIIIEEAHYTWFSDWDPIGDFRVEDNKIYYKPRQDRNGTVNIAYVVVDGRGGKTTVSVKIIVKAVNDYNPIAEDDQFEVTEDSYYNNFNVLINDKDEDGDSLIIESVEESQNSKAYISSDKKIIKYFPNKDFYGEDTFTYTVSDGYGKESTATVKVTVSPSQDSPTANDDEVQVDEDSVGNILQVMANDLDVDGDTITIKNVGQASDGLVHIQNNTIVYTPNSGFVGQDTLSYTIEDVNGYTGTATVNITVANVNDAPLAQNDEFSVDEDSTDNIFNALSNDWDIEGDNLTIESILQSQNGRATIGNAQDGNNVLENKTIVYTPNVNFNGQDTITYTVNDGNGGISSATVNITVNSINDTPEAVNDYYSVYEDAEQITFNVLSNDLDIDNDELTITNVEATYSNADSLGTFSIKDNKIQYKPNESINGKDYLKYTISDGNGGVDVGYITIDVEPVNDIPTLSDDNFEVQEDSQGNTFNVLDNDSDIDGDNLLIDSIGQSENGTAVIAENKIEYTPNSNFNGQDSLTYTASDGYGGTASATVNITVTNVNDAPVALDDEYSVDEFSLDNELDVLSNDSDLDGDTLTITDVNDPNGFATIVNNKISFNANGAGRNIITYTICDGNGGTSTATVTITVNSVNDAPQAVDDEFEVEEYSLNNELDVLSNDSDLDGDTLTIVSIDAPYYRASIVNNKIQYSPESLYMGNTDSFTYTISDGNGHTSTATVRINVIAINSPPIAQDDQYEVYQGSNYNEFNVLANDSDIDNNTLTIESVGESQEAAIEIYNNRILYTPNPWFTGQDTITYKINDGKGQVSEATIYIDVIARQTTFVAQSDKYEVDTNSIKSLNVLSNDLNWSGYTHYIESVSDNSIGSVTLVGNMLEYSSYGINEETYDSFTYTIRNIAGQTSTARVFVHIKPTDE